MIQIKIPPAPSAIPEPAPELVLVQFPKCFPVYAPPEFRIREIKSVIRNLDQDDFHRSAVIFHPVTLQPVKVWRKIAQLDPGRALERGKPL